MTTSSETKSPGPVHEMIPLGDYAWPRSEAQQSIGHLFEKLKSGVFPVDSEDAIDTDALQTLSNDKLDTAVRQSLKTSLLASLDLEYRDWALSKSGDQSQRLFVHPPMNDDLLTEWALGHGLPIVEVGSRIKDMPDASCLVIAKIEDYFVRGHDSMEKLFALFSELASYQGRVLIGCNSWALRFLEQFDDVRLLLGRGRTFPAYDASAIAVLLESGLEDSSIYFSVASGEPVFARDGDGELCDPFLKDLSESSLGHPWVAVEAFLRGISEAKDQDDDGAGHRTWVALPAGRSLAQTRNDMLLFALHCLLIHGPRKIAELNPLLPKPPPNGVWKELEQVGFVEIKNGHVSCVIRNYPDIRSELGAAGFNLDKL